jgi:hypothetical protein
MHLIVGGGERRRVILKVHTLLKWRDRRTKRMWERASKVIAVKVTLLCVGCRVHHPQRLMLFHTCTVSKLSFPAPAGAASHHNGL